VSGDRAFRQALGGLYERGDIIASKYRLDRIIGVGGIMTAEDALEKLAAGADLVQLYTGFIYEGPGLIREINKRIIKS